MTLLDSSTSVLPIVGVGLFAGVQLCIHSSTYPAMAALDDNNAVQFFSRFYPPLKLIQPALLILAALASLTRITLTATTTASMSSLAYSTHVLVILHTLFVLVWTVVVMIGDNNRLLAAAEQKWKESKKGEIRTMLRSWGVRNEARVWPALILFVLLVVAETGKH